MYYLAGFVVLLGVIAMLGGAALWALTDFEQIGKSVAFYGLVAVLFGLGPVLLLGPGSGKPVSPQTAATERPQEPVAPVPVKYELKLGSWHCNTEYGYHEIDGQIRNVSDHPIDSVTIFATFKGSNGEVIKTASALIQYQPIMPGQTSPFKVMATENPLVRKCYVQVGTLFGGTLAVDY